jgi:hypothetical protein
MAKLEAGETQCHQRAMYWSYEMSASQNINSMKVMVFYSQKFIKTFRRSGFWGTKDYKWWYHTAPYVFVKDGRGGVLEVVLDRTFMDQPVTIDQWTHHFLAEEALNFVDGEHRGYMPELSTRDTHCKVLTNYRELGQYNALFAQEESKYADWLDDQKGYAGKLNGRLKMHAKEPWCMVRKFPMFYMQPDSVQQLDCDPTRDAYKRADKRMPGGEPQFPCLHTSRQSFFDKLVARDLIQAYSEVASSSEKKEIKRVYGPYAK